MMNVWQKLPMFWRFQLAGWTTYVGLSFPLKLVLFGSFWAAVLVTIFRDGLVLLLTIGMREIYRRFCPDRTNFARIVGVVFLTSSAGGLILAGFSCALYEVFGFQEEVARILKSGFQIFYTHGGLCLCWSLLYFGIIFMREADANDLRLARAEAGQRDAELQFLKTQIDSHFLFNALNTIWADLDRSQKALKNLVQALADYLRYSLAHRDENYVPLEDEFEMVQDYLTVEKARFRDRIDVERQIDEAARQLLVPVMILQPLIENAIKYGLETSEIRLSVRMNILCPQPGVAQIEIANTGSWVEPSPTVEGGVGLENLKRRLALLYPEAHEFEVLAEYGWVTIRVRIETMRALK